MGSHDASPAQSATPTRTGRISSSFRPLYVSNAVLSALSIANFGLISSEVAWLLAQRRNDHSYRVDFPGAPFDLNVEPKNLWVDQIYASNGVAGYGFLVGLFGVFVAWRVRKNNLIPALFILQLLAIIFTLGTLAFVFLVTYRTTGQHIRLPIAANNEGRDYPEFKWTPETWFKAVLDSPLANDTKRNEIESKVAAMVAWRWMLVPILIFDIIACGITALACIRMRRGRKTRADPSGNASEK